MLRKIPLIILGLSATIPAHAITPYFSVGGSLGLSSGDGTLRSGGFAGAFGVRYEVADINMRTELEYNNAIYSKQYTVADITYDYDMKTQLYLVNMLADIHIGELRSGLQFGLTAGIADYTRDLPDALDIYDANKTSFVYGATAGFAIYLIGGVSADVGIRYLRTADSDGIDSLNPYFTLRYGF